MVGRWVGGSVVGNRLAGRAVGGNRSAGWSVVSSSLLFKFFFSKSTRGWANIKLKTTTLLRVFIHVV